MTLIQGDAELPIRALLDPGSQIPVMSLVQAKKWSVELIERSTSRMLFSFNNTLDSSGGRFYTKSLALLHKEHFSCISFELSDIGPDYDIILPHWWLQEHQPSNFWGQDPDKIVFDSPQCLGCRRSLAEVATTKATLDAALAAVPDKFRKFIPIMTEEAAMRLADHQPWDHQIELRPGETPRWGPLYSMSAMELEILRAWLDKMLKTGRIRESSSSCSSPLMFVGKKDPEDPLRPVVDFRALNDITVPVRYPLPLISELQDRLAGSKFYTKIDLKTGFNLVRIAKGHEWKTAFRCRYGLYEHLVMPFGLMNAPATFQAMMNGIFQDLIDVGVLAYMDDILIYAATQKEHDDLVVTVLQRLTKYKLTVAAQKSFWDVRWVEFLGYNITPAGLSMSKEKTDSMECWQVPASLKGAQQFVGFANFYRRFIKNFSAIVKPLTDASKLGKKDWKLTPEMKRSFTTLKKAFLSAPVLQHFDPEQVAIVETDASDFAVGAVLSQKGTDKKLHPVAFHSRKMSPAEINYEIHDKELLAIVDAFTKWRHYLEGAKHKVEVFTDHQNLAYFTTAKILNRRQARWAQQLAGFWFIINYRPGAQNEKADVLSRLPQHQPPKGGCEDQPITTVLHKEHFSAGAVFLLSSDRLCSISTPRWTDYFVTQVKQHAVNDPDYQSQVASPGKDLELRDGLLYRKGRLWIPDGLQKAVLETEHDTKVAGHMGMDKTMELVTRNFWWPGFEESVRSFVRSCLECQRNKTPRHAPAGLLRSLELHYKPWQSVAMDFITDLPLSNGCDSIWTMIDPFTKMAHFIPLKQNEKTSEHLIRIFLRSYWRFHSIPLDIISDRDSRFTAHLWKDFLKILGIKPRMSTAFHPQTDGQTERLNQILEVYLRAFVNYEMDNWEDLLPTAEFAYNNCAQSSTGISPFYANYGYNPVGHNPPAEDNIRNPASRSYVHWMTQVHDECRKQLERARSRAKQYADRRRIDAPAYSEGDLVMLNAKNIKTKRPAKKLDKRMLGPFKVIQVISPSAMRLELPSRWRIHNSFHVSLLEPYRSGIQGTPDAAQILREAAPVEEEEFEVEKVKDSSTLENGTVMYLVKWEGWPAKKHWTWEPFEHFSSTAPLDDFHARHPDKPRDNRLSPARVAPL